MFWVNIECCKWCGCLYGVVFVYIEYFYLVLSVWGLLRCGVVLKVKFVFIASQ